MKNLMKLAGALAVVTSLAVFAQSTTKTPTPAAQTSAKAAADAKMRAEMTGHCAAMDKQIGALEQAIKRGDTTEQAKEIAALKQSVKQLSYQLQNIPRSISLPYVESKDTD